MTGLELLEKLSKDMDYLRDRVDLMDATIKALNNRIAQLVLSSKDKDLEKPVQINVRPVESVKAVFAQPVNRQKEKLETKSPVTKLVYKKVMGYLKNSDNRPIDDALVLIYDKNNDVIASSNSDTAGYWETMVAPGKYLATIKKSGFKDFNKSFVVNENDKHVEVA